MLELYHAPISTCSQKVRMALSEKGLTWEDHLIDLQKGEQFDPAYTKLNPNAVVPTLVDDGAALIESTLINEYVDEKYDPDSLKPNDAGARHAMRLFIKKTDDPGQAAIAVLTYAIGVRPIMLAQPKEQVMALFQQIPLEEKRKARISVFENGVHAPEVARSLDVFVSLFGEMEALLSDNAWLVADKLSLADIAAMPYVLRVDHLGLTPMIGEDKHPNLWRWYQRVKDQESYEKGVNKYLAPAVVDMFQGAGREVWPDVQRILGAA